MLRYVFQQVDRYRDDRTQRHAFEFHYEWRRGGLAGPNLGAGNTVPVGDGFQGNDGIVAWGRWIDNGSGFSGALSGGEGGILHYVTGIPTTDSRISLGSTGTYTLLGGGVAGSSTGAGTITSASMSVDFSAATVTSLSVGMRVGLTNYVLSDGGAAINGFGTGANFGAYAPSVSKNGGACSACSSIGVNGAFFGAGAARAGVAFKFNDGQDIAGAAALKK